MSTSHPAWSVWREVLTTLRAEVNNASSALTHPPDYAADANGKQKAFKQSNNDSCEKFFSHSAIIN